LAFLHGFGTPPSNYEEFINELARTNEVVAPVAYGINYLKPQPANIDEYAEITAEFTYRLGISRLAGHSLGATVALAAGSRYSCISDLIAINPILPVSYSIPGFAVRAVHKTNREIWGLEGELSSRGFGLSVSAQFMANLLRKPLSSYRIIKDICMFDYSHVQVTQPALVLYGEDDEYFKMDDANEKTLRNAVHRVLIKRIPERNHDWPVFNPRQASGEINNFLVGQNSSE